MDNIIGKIKSDCTNLPVDVDNRIRDHIFSAEDSSKFLESVFDGNLSYQSDGNSINQLIGICLLAIRDINYRLGELNRILVWKERD